METPRERSQYSDPDKQTLSHIGACFICKKPGCLVKFCPQKGKIAVMDKDGEEPRVKEETDSGNGNP